MTKTEIAREKALYKRALKNLEKCNGDCRNCEKMLFRSAPVERGIAYAFGCDLLDAAGLCHMSNSPYDVRQEAIDAVNFELSGLEIKERYIKKQEA